MEKGYTLKGALKYTGMERPREIFELLKWMHQERKKRRKDLTRVGLILDKTFFSLTGRS